MFKRFLLPKNSQGQKKGFPSTNQGHIPDFEKEAIVDEPILPNRPGRVRFRGSWWNARCLQNITITPGEIVYVAGRIDLTLLVEPTSFK